MRRRPMPRRRPLCRSRASCRITRPERRTVRKTKRPSQSGTPVPAILTVVAPGEWARWRSFVPFVWINRRWRRAGRRFSRHSAPSDTSATSPRQQLAIRLATRVPVFSSLKLDAAERDGMTADAWLFAVQGSLPLMQAAAPVLGSAQLIIGRSGSMSIIDPITMSAPTPE
jgi:hypothetical protein